MSVENLRHRVLEALEDVERHPLPDLPEIRKAPSLAIDMYARPEPLIHIEEKGVSASSVL